MIILMSRTIVFDCSQQSESSQKLPEPTVPQVAHVHTLASLFLRHLQQNDIFIAQKREEKLNYKKGDDMLFVNALHECIAHIRPRGGSMICLLVQKETC